MEGVDTIKEVSYICIRIFLERIGGGLDIGYIFITCSHP